MRANERALLAACIDTGIYAGWTRAHKHTDEPHELRIQEEIDNAIWYEIDQYFVFDSERDLCDEVVEGFDHLEKEREWVGLKWFLFEENGEEYFFPASTDAEALESAKKRGATLVREATKCEYTCEGNREWVGLTQEELQDLCVKSYNTDNAGETHFNRGYFADAIEAKLKEKNNG